MNTRTLQRLIHECQGFLDFINVQSKPDLVFVNKKGVNEYKVNHLYEPSDTIYFNTEFFKKLDYNYALLLLLHEIYHFAKQGITSIYDVTFIRDSKQWHLMQLVDVEADLQVAGYLKEKAILPSFAHYLRSLHCGNAVFRDKHVRHPKLERFIGSIVSVATLYKTDKKVVYLPQLAHNTLLFISIDFDNHQLKINRLRSEINDLEGWTATFQNASLMTPGEYINALVILSDYLHLLIKEKQYSHEA